jgi:hypothetical protein
LGGERVRVVWCLLIPPFQKTLVYPACNFCLIKQFFVPKTVYLDVAARMFCIFVIDTKKVPSKDAQTLFLQSITLYPFNITDTV